MNKISFSSIKSIVLRKTNHDLSSGCSLRTNVCAGGDQYIEPKRVRRWSVIKKQGDADTYSSDSLKVNIGDLADAEELKKITQVVANRRQEKDSSSSVEQQSNNLIEDVYILNGFRMHSKEILNMLTQKDKASYLFNYGERDTGRKLLSIAAEVGWYEGVIFLLNRGVNINETDRENRTALMDCLTSLHTNIITALVKRSECNLNIQSLTGHTATHYAIMMNKISFFEILIKSGARVDLQNDRGENVLHHIINYKRKDCWKILKHLYNAKYLKYLIHMETSEHKNCLTLAYEHQPDIYFFKELLSYVDLRLINIELYQSWGKASKLIRNLLSYKKIYDDNVCCR